MLRNRSRVADIFTLLARNHTARAFKAHIRNSPAPPVLLYIITLRCFPPHFSSFYFFSADLAADRTHRPAQYTATSPLPARPNKPVRLPSSHASSLRYAATFRLRALFASCSRAFRQVRGSFCRRTAVRRPSPTLSAPSIPASGAGERISLCSRFMWNIRLVIRQNLNVYRGFRSFMHIYTLRHCMFFAYAFAFSVPAILFPLPLRS